MTGDPHPASDHRTERGKEPPRNRDRWLLSYADFLTLLLALFVVLYASARVDAEKNRGLFVGLQSSFALGETPSEAADPKRAGELRRGDDGDPRLVLEATGSLAPLAQLQTSLVKQIALERVRSKTDPGMTLQLTDRGLVISLAAGEYFPAGGAEIPPARKRMLDAIAPLLASEDGSLRFEGHSDDLSVKKNAFPSNWELSSARAAAIARYFIEEHDIDPRRVATTGYAAYRPISDGDAPAERARNRRVEIVVVADGADLVAQQTPSERERALGRLLEKLPPLSGDPDEARRPYVPGRARGGVPLRTPDLIEPP